MKTLIVAGTFRQAMDYIRRNGLNYPREVDYIGDPRAILCVDRSVEIVLTETWDAHPHIWDILRIVRSKGMKVIHADPRMTKPMRELFIDYLSEKKIQLMPHQMDMARVILSSNVGQKFLSAGLSSGKSFLFATLEDFSKWRPS